MGKRCFVFILCLVAITGSSVFSQNQWPQFRGPHGAGVASDSISLPSKLENPIWKTPIPHGLSSPCIWEDKIFLTGITGTELELFCINRKDGAILWRAQAWYEFIERVHRSNSPASPTPVTDGKWVCAYFGSSGLMCFDFNGKEVWSRHVRNPPNLYGTASSLVMANDLLIFCNDNQHKSYVEAINPATGETVWTKERKGLQHNWTTPMIWNNRGVEELVINGQGLMRAYQLSDGEPRWDLPGLTNEPCVTPIAVNNMIYVTSYNMKTNTEVIGLPAWETLITELDKDGDGELTLEEAKPNKSVLSRADADGEGDHPLWMFFRFLDADRNKKITKTEWAKLVNWVDSFPQENAILAVKPPEKEEDAPQVVWKHEKGVPEVPSPLCYNNKIYLVKNGGMVTCLDANTGKKLYSGRLGAGGPYYASPVAGDHKIFTASIRGVVTILDAGDTLKVLSRNDLKERISATPALVDNKVYVRTNKHLYAFGKQD